MQTNKNNTQQAVNYCTKFVVIETTTIPWHGFNMTHTPTNERVWCKSRPKVPAQIKFLKSIGVTF